MVTEIPGLLGRIPVVMQRIVEDALDGLAGVGRDESEDGVHCVPQVVGLDLDVDRAAADAGRAPVHEDAGPDPQRRA